jgi:hypothetical protein
VVVLVLVLVWLLLWPFPLLVVVLVVLAVLAVLAEVLVAHHCCSKSSLIWTCWSCHSIKRR